MGNGREDDVVTRHGEVNEQAIKLSAIDGLN